MILYTGWDRDNWSGGTVQLLSYSVQSGYYIAVRWKEGVYGREYDGYAPESQIRDMVNFTSNLDFADKYNIPYFDPSRSDPQKDIDAYIAQAAAEEAEKQRQRELQAAAEEAEKQRQRELQAAAEEAAAKEAASKGVSEVALTNGVTSPPSQGVNDSGLMDIINTLITQKAQVQDTGDADIKEYEKQISDLKNQIAQAQEASETAKIEELAKRIEELNTQKAQAQASKETDIKELERQIADLKKPEQSRVSQIPMKIIGAVVGVILIVILLIAVIIRGRK